MTELPAIIVDDVSKQFVLPREQMHTLKERALHPLRKPSADVLQALSHVSFDVAKGEFFGIVGRNGSGKSTLLKCLTGIYGRDQGDIYVNGRLSAFIELGVGFNPDLAAQDNILLNAAMLGLSAKEARSRVDAILDFAELRDFADLKVKNYSSGMLVRLAFSVMIQVDADILLIDEVLAVGDASFQQKCFDEFERVRRDNKTVLLVTHDMASVRRFCDRAMLLEAGTLVAIGDAEDVGNRYLQINFSEEAREAERAAVRAAAERGEDVEPAILAGTGGSHLGDGGVEITQIWFEDEAGIPQLQLASGEHYRFAFNARFDTEVVDPWFSVYLTNESDQRVMAVSSSWEEPRSGHFLAGDEVTYRVRFKNILAAGRYHVSAAVTEPGGRWLRYNDRVFSIVITSTRDFGALVEVPHEIELVRRQVEPRP